MKKLISFLLSVSLWLTPLSMAGASELLDELKDLTADERDSLKNIEISDGLRNSLENPLSNVNIGITEDDRKALRLLGYSEAEIDQVSIDSFVNGDGKEKFKSKLNNYADAKNKEINDGVMKSLVPGLGSAVIGLAFASLLGIVVGVRCTNQPSALAFAGTSAAWVGLEMMIWKGYQIRMDDINTIMEATEIPKKLEAKINDVKATVKRLEAEYKKNPTGNYEAFLEANKSDVNKLKNAAKEFRDFLNKAKDSQFGSLRSIQESLELAAETSRKKARNATVAAVGYAAASGLAALEAMNILGGGGTCASGFKSGSLWDFLGESLIPSAHAGFASVGDLDKIGIPLGGGMAAAYLGFEKTFADKIFSTPIGRSVTFLAMAGIATVAALKLKEAAKFLDKQAAEMDIFVTAIEGKLSKVEIAFSDANALIDELKEEILPQLDQIAQSLKDKLKESDLEDKLKDKLKNDLGPEVDSIKERVASELEGIDKDKIADQLEEEFLSSGELEKELSNGELPSIESDDFKLPVRSSFIDYFFESAHAAYSNMTPVSCFKRTPTFLLEDTSCHCRGNKSCAKTPFFKSLPLKTKAANVKEFASMAVAAGRLVNQSSNAIMTGSPRAGLRGFQKVAPLRDKLLKGSQSILGNNFGQSVNTKVVAKMVRGALKSTRPALGEYYAKRGRVVRQAQQAKARVKKQNPGSELSEVGLLKASMKRKLLAVKALGNPSLSQLSSTENVQDEEVYNYSKQSITRDPSKNIFEVIKKRYLIIQSQGRLGL